MVAWIMPFSHGKGGPREVEQPCLNFYHAIPHIASGRLAIGMLKLPVHRAADETVLRMSVSGVGEVSVFEVLTTPAVPVLFAAPWRRMHESDHDRRFATNAIAIVLPEIPVTCDWRDTCLGLMVCGDVADDMVRPLKIRKAWLAQPDVQVIEPDAEAEDFFGYASPGLVRKCSTAVLAVSGMVAGWTREWGRSSDVVRRRRAIALSKAEAMVPKPRR